MDDDFEKFALEQFERQVEFDRTIVKIMQRQTTLIALVALVAVLALILAVILFRYI